MAVSTLNFAASVDAWVQETKARAESVFKKSAEDVVGSMISLTPRDTGFLRASLLATIEAPVGMNPIARPVEGKVYEYNPEPANLVINGSELGQTIYASFTAAYAAHQEYGTSKMQGRGFVRLSAQKWATIVAANVAKARQAGLSGSTPGT